MPGCLIDYFHFVVIAHISGLNRDGIAMNAAFLIRALRVIDGYAALSFTSRRNVVP